MPPDPTSTKNATEVKKEEEEIEIPTHELIRSMQSTLDAFEPLMRAFGCKPEDLDNDHEPDGLDLSSLSESDTKEMEERNAQIRRHLKLNRDRILKIDSKKSKVGKNSNDEAARKKDEKRIKTIRKQGAVLIEELLDLKPSMTSKDELMFMLQDKESYRKLEKRFKKRDLLVVSSSIPLRKQIEKIMVILHTAVDRCQTLLENPMLKVDLPFVDQLSCVAQVWKKYPNGGTSLAPRKICTVDLARIVRDFMEKNDRKMSKAFTVYCEKLSDPESKHSAV